MPAAEMLRTLVAYEAAQWQRTWQSVRTLTPGALHAELPYAHGSVWNQMFHVTEVLYRWLHGLQGDPNAIQLQLAPAAHATLEALHARHESLLAELVEYVSAIDETVLESTLPGMRGPTWQVIAHLVNHGTDHRAQVLAALHHLGAPTFAQDLIFTLWFPQPAPWDKPLPGSD